MFPLLLPERALAGFDLVLDFTRDMPERDRVAEAPLAIDQAILARLGLPTDDRWMETSGEREIRRIALFPISSTPLRAIPPPLAAYLTAGLKEQELTVEIVVDPRTGQGSLFLRESRSSWRRSQGSSSARIGAARSTRAARRASAGRPVMSRSTANS